MNTYSILFIKYCALWNWCIQAILFIEI